MNLELMNMIIATVLLPRLQLDSNLGLVTSILGCLYVCYHNWIFALHFYITVHGKGIILSNIGYKAGTLNSASLFPTPYHPM